MVNTDVYMPLFCTELYWQEGINPITWKFMILVFCVFFFLRYLYTDFHSDWTNLYSLQLCIMFPLTLSPFQQFLLLLFMYGLHMNMCPCIRRLEVNLGCLSSCSAHHGFFFFLWLLLFVCLFLFAWLYKVSLWPGYLA